MKKYIEANKWQLLVAVLLLAGVAGVATGVLPQEALAFLGSGALLGPTSTAQLGNGATLSISAGSPTSYILVANVHNINWDDGSNPQVETTHLGSPNAKEFLPGFADSGKLTAEVDLDMGDAGQIAMQAAKASRIACDVKVVLAGGTTPTWTARGFITKFGKALGVDNPVKGSLEVLITGPWTAA